MRQVLGIEGGKLSLSGGALAVQAFPASPVNGKLAGAWTAAASAQYGGVMRLRYIFNADGTYTFKAERSSTSNKWWTTEESGSYSVDGGSLTISPRVSKATLRNLNGVVQETRNNALERVTYKWTTHFSKVSARQTLSWSRHKRLTVMEYSAATVSFRTLIFTRRATVSSGASKL